MLVGSESVFTQKRRDIVIVRDFAYSRQVIFRQNIGKMDLTFPVVGGFPYSLPFREDRSR